MLSNGLLLDVLDCFGAAEHLLRMFRGSGSVAAALCSSASWISPARFFRSLCLLHHFSGLQLFAEALLVLVVSLPQSHRRSTVRRSMELQQQLAAAGSQEQRRLSVPDALLQMQQAVRSGEMQQVRWQPLVRLCGYCWAAVDCSGACNPSKFHVPSSSLLLQSNCSQQQTPCCSRVLHTRRTAAATVVSQRCCSITCCGAVQPCTCVPMTSLCLLMHTPKARLFALLRPRILAPPC